MVRMEYHAPVSFKLINNQNNERNFSAIIPSTLLKHLRARLPISLHAELARRAEVEGVSLNTLAIALLAAGLSKTNISKHDKQ